MLEVPVTWSISEVADMSKVTSRTLRHYHDIGLLAPAYVGANGYRYYEQEQLLRLQQVLLLRELGLGLETISEVLDGQRDSVETLRHHQRWLRDERQRLERLAKTVSRTISQLQGGNAMPAEDLFEGFAEKQAQQEAALADRYGEEVREHFRTSRERTEDWTKQDYLDAQRQGEELDAKMAELMRSGAGPGSTEVLDVVSEHYASVSQFWTPNRGSYTGLGQLYVDDPEFKARYDEQAPGLAEYLRDAIAAYASERLN